MQANGTARGRYGWPVVTMAVCALVGMMVAAPTRAQIPTLPKYKVVDLGPLSDIIYSRAFAINNAGQVAGMSRASLSQYRAVLWNGTTPTNLGALTGYLRKSYAYGINSLGQAVGASYGLTESRGVVWDGTNMVELRTFGGDYSVAHGINDSGFVVGSADTKWHYSSIPYAFIWKDLNANGQDDPGEMQGLFLSVSAALAISKYNVITGWFTASGGNRHAFRYWGGETTDLGTFGGVASTGYGVNESGLIVGEAQNALARYRAFVWEPHFEPLYGPVWSKRNLGTLSGYTHSVAFGINKDGMIVGKVHNNQAGQVNDTDRAVRFMNRGPEDLNGLISATSGWTLLEARGVNDAGQIVGIGKINGEYHAFRLNPLFLSP